MISVFRSSRQQLFSFFLIICIQLWSTPLVIATDVFQNSITDEQTTLIQKISGVCPGQPTKAKQTRINDTMIKGPDLYLLWSYTCDSTSSGTASIMISIKSTGVWATYVVALDRKFYVDPNYLGAPNFVDLNATGVGIIWVDHFTTPGGPKLLGKIFNGTNPSSLAGASISEIATSTDCNIGNILPYSNSLGSYITFVTNNGGAEMCAGNIYSTQFIGEQWSTPVAISLNQQVGDLYAKSNLVIDSNGVSYLCYVTVVSHPNTSNKVGVVELNNGVATEVYSKSYPNIEENSAHYCVMKLDQSNKPHLFVAEVAWSVLGTGRTAKPETTKYQEVIKKIDTWEFIPNSLAIVNADLDGSWASAYFCKQCDSKLNLVVSSESNKIRIYEYGTSGNWTKVRDFNEGYDQSVNSIQEVWGDSTTGFTFIVNNYAEELEGSWGYQKGHYLDLRPTFSPSGVNKLLFSDSVLDAASTIYREQFTTINTRLTSRNVLKIGNSILSMWEDLGSTDAPPGVILIESVIKENPSCINPGYSPAMPQSLSATSLYTTAILNFEYSSCGTTPTQAVVEVKDIASEVIQVVQINNPTLSLQVPNLQAGKSFSFRVKFSNINGTSAFTKFSNNVVALNAPKIFIPPAEIPPAEIPPIQEATEKQLEQSTQVPPPLNNNRVKLTEGVNKKLSSLGISVFSKDETMLAIDTSKLTISAVSSTARLKSFNLSSKLFSEISIKPRSREKVKIQITVNKKTVDLGSTAPTSKFEITLPAMKFKPGRYLITLISPSGKKEFLRINAK